MPNRALALSFLAVLLCGSAHGAAPRLVKDINPIALPSGSTPGGYTVAGGLAYFYAGSLELGTGLWRTDGTAAGTLFLTADSASVFAGSDRSAFLAVYPEGVSGAELWQTSGLPANTFRVAGPFRSLDGGLWVAGRNLLFFSADDGLHGSELWRSDGTPAGTFAVTDLRPGAAGSSPVAFTALGGRLFFVADDGEHGRALWVSDGTAQGTQLVYDSVPGSASEVGPSGLTAAGRTLYFDAGDRQLWATDGTAAGTVKLTDFSFSGSQAIRGTVPLGDRLVFVGSDSFKGDELWITDGTRSGTRALTKFKPSRPFGDSSRPLPLASQGSRLVFLADDGTNGRQPWVTDGTPKGTRLIRRACPVSCNAISQAGTVSGSLFYFVGWDAHGAEPWVSDGTAQGTREVKDICPGPCGSYPGGLMPAAGRVFFFATEADTVFYNSIFSSDGTPQKTVRVFRPIGPQPYGERFRSAVLGGSLLFTANDYVHGEEPWRSNGTPRGSGLLRDLATSDLGGSDPSGLRAVGDQLYFFAAVGRHRSLWRTGGSEAETASVAEVDDARLHLLDRSFATVGERLFLVVPTPTRYSLWLTGGEAGARELLPEGVAVDLDPGLCAVGNLVYFVANDEVHGKELWVSDGTLAGTRQVADVEDGALGSQPRNLASFQGRLYFTATQAELGRELWRTDGSAAGTVLVKDLDPRPGFGSAPRLLTAHAGRLYFFAQDEGHGVELWSSDGTTAGTLLAAETVPGPAGAQPTHLFSAGSRLLFFNDAAPVGFGLWASDGTTAGTRRIRDSRIAADPHGRFHTLVFQGALYFLERESRQLWRSDGTEGGTAPFLDGEGLPIREASLLQPFAGRFAFLSTVAERGSVFVSDGTPAGTSKRLQLTHRYTSVPQELLAAGAHLYFQNWDPATGTELWVLDAE